MNTFWIEKRKNLKILKNHSNQSSKLKKKQTIINKLKNLSVENFEALLSELENENFNKFHTEIVNNLLTSHSITPPFKASFQSAFEYIHKTVEIIYLFSFDLSFLGFLASTLKKGYQENWAFCCILMELSLLGTKSKSSIEVVATTLLNNLKSHQLYFILYCIESFNIQNSIFTLYIKNEIKTVNEDNYEILKKITTILGMDDELKLPNSYVEIIKPAPGEFSFYEETEAPNGFIFPEFTPSIIKHIEKKKIEPYILDFIGQSIHNHPELISKLINKKKYIEFIPSLARIFSKAIKNSKCHCNAIFQCQKSRKDLILIAECYKFGLFSHNEIFSLINQLIDQNQIANLCTVLENLGRFIFYKKDTNRQSLKILERIRHSSIDSSSKLQVSQCISMLLNPSFCKIDIVDFLRWFFNTTDYETSSLFEYFLGSFRFLLITLLHPSIFEKKEGYKRYIESIVNKCNIVILENNNELGTDFRSLLIMVYLVIIPKIYRKNKALVLGYIEAVAILAQKHTRQGRILDILLEENIEDRMKYRLVLLLLDSFDNSIHQKYIEKIKDKNRGDDEFKAMLFNFCEKHNCRCEIEDADSFEREFELMQESD